MRAVMKSGTIRGADGVQVSDCGGGFNREGEDRGFVGFWAAGLTAQGKHTSKQLEILNPRSDRETNVGDKRDQAVAICK